ncbi:MAG: type III pantothenate kinase [Bacteroidales bacterium]
MIIIDAGNTRIKIYFFRHRKIINLYTYHYGEIDACFEILHSYTHSPIIISDVSGKFPTHKLQHTHTEIFVCTKNIKLPIQIDYTTGDTLGFDRIADAAGAVSLCPNTHKLIIDAGTALTIDYVDDTNTFRGGIISPGMNMRFTALHEKTGKLPLCAETHTIELHPDSTTKAIQSGVVQGITFEISEYISAYTKLFPDITIFLCGGDTFFFEKILKKPIFAEANLNAYGLHSIYEYNVTA